MTSDPVSADARPGLTVGKTVLALVLVLAGVLCIFVVLVWMIPESGRPISLPETPETKTREATRRALDDAARTRLSTYGWVDKERGVVRLPVDRAAELVLESRRKEKAR